MRLAVVAVAAVAACASGESSNLRGERHLAVDKKLYAVSEIAATDLGGQAILKSSGQLWTWGDSAAPAEVPVAVDAATTKNLAVTSVSGVSSTGNHQCAIVKDGKLRCWGDNTNGELGTGDTTDYATPVSLDTAGTGGTPLFALTSVDDFAVGSDHTCALKYGNVLCWGLNAEGQLGRSSGETDVDVKMPPPATLVGGVSQVSCRGATCCAIQSGDLYCWGDNTGGKLGQGDDFTELFSRVPVKVPIPFSSSLGKAVKQVSVGNEHVCAVLGSSGAVFCWGDHTNGELGNPTLTAGEVYRSPQRVQLPRRHYAASVAVSNDATCFTFTNGRTGCAGSEVDIGTPLGLSVPFTATPTLFKTTVAPKNIVGGDHHFCVRGKNAFVVCWGDDAAADQLGGSVYPGDYSAKTYIKFE
jgi:alpha-tubulin suppressor-like RCC1 family protein